MGKINRFDTDDDLRRQIRKMLTRGSQAQVAEHLGMSQPALSQFLDGSRPNASDKMLARMGYRPQRFYRKR